MRIVLISDTHGLHRQLEVPPGDLLIHAGDFTF
jgi:predicted phosphodiesterase